MSLGLLGDSCFYSSSIELLPFPAPVSGAKKYHKCSPQRTRCAKLLLTSKCENTDYESGKVGVVVTVGGSSVVLQQPQTAAKEEKAQVHITFSSTEKSSTGSCTAESRSFKVDRAVLTWQWRI